MDTGWQEVGSGKQLAEALALDRVGVPALERLILAPGSNDYLRVETDEESSTPGAFDIRVPGTRWYFNVTACRSLKGDIIVALTAFLVTHSVPAAAAAAALRKLGDNLDRLSEEEVAVVRAIVRACPGNPYEVAVPVEDVRAKFRDLGQLDDLLDSLQAKGVVEGRRRDRIKLVY
jgi:hypothetical protein